MSENLFLCIHAHFYQPPRENPWIEEIEPQDSAAPFHDWNERVYRESYRPNARARVLDFRGNVADLVNNFEKISFNFGPTLFSWLADKHPGTYRLIIEADRLSCTQHGGHGNAIAQVYSHPIMPLANRRDKITQVKWGMEDFRRRFGREPEGIWLPETACNDETLEVLALEGIRFTILEPHQAQAVKPLDHGDWQDVSGGQIDPKKPYRYFLKNHPGKHIDLFFYDGPVSKAVGFEEVLRDSHHFAARLRAAAGHERHEPQIVHIATDGETYGHHKKFGDRALAYLLSHEAPRQGFQIINYGEYLERFPPRDEVRIKAGENGEGTSWSCVHGVKRWKENCGCRTGGPLEWNQEWRKPLREALDWLSGEIAQSYEHHMAQYMKDPWGARDGYISVILDRSMKATKEFFARHAVRELNREEESLCLKFLEAQRHSLLMFTSCGWFFSEIAGIETIQVIEYGARAIQLMREASGQDFEPEFLSRLSSAKSNLAELKDGRGVYERFVRPRICDLERITAFYAISSLTDSSFEGKDRADFYCFNFHVQHLRKESSGDMTLNFGRVTVRSDVTYEEKDLIFIALHVGTYDFRCSVKPFTSQEECDRLEDEIFEELHLLHIVELLRKMDEAFGEQYYSLKDLPQKEKRRIITLLTHEVIEKISSVHEQLYDEHRRMSEIYRSINLPIPDEIRYAAEHTLSRRIMSSVRQLAREGFHAKKTAPLYRLVENAKAFDIGLKKREIAKFLTAELEKRTDNLSISWRPETVVECINILKVSKKMDISLELEHPQENLFALVKQWTARGHLPEAISQDSAQNLLILLHELRISPDGFKKRLQKITE